MAGDKRSPVERRRSHGIGGAGNMHLPSVIKRSEETPDSAVAAGGPEKRRRSSMWSLTSSGSQGKGTIFDRLLRRGSKAEEASDGVNTAAPN
ncbi:hypothetical protein LTR62_007035 [Meristemomyces frigidus]|uniref:Uncharacterized protein n=1 Tax=Meristemomyces frigidus TaxID=1508187 RepID=A0AAN7TFD1_9PEZI|nr:hypothetical protein LTR62_007035 [Meristemomyces frigidus]